MKLIAGVDIGNSTTEVCIAQMDSEGRMRFLSSSSRATTGTKGTIANTAGIINGLEVAMERIGKNVKELSLICINEAAPVIGDTAMETITETIITESSMIGHNPSTPAGAGQATGTILYMQHLEDGKTGIPYIVVASSKYSYESIAETINSYAKKLSIVGMILQADEAVLVENRLEQKIPIVDEVKYVEKIPEGIQAAIEVALVGQSIRMLSNPYGIATLLKLDANETKKVTPIAKSLIGKQSAVVIKTPFEHVKENKLPAGEIYFLGDSKTSVNVDAGADKIMEVLSQTGKINDISGQSGTNVGNMLRNIKKGMGELTKEEASEIKITDILAVDTLAPVQIFGALAGETCMEKAVGVAAMVKTKQLPMEKIAEELKKRLHIYVKVAGVEAVMASLGALTTPGTKLPLAILDLGGGSTDAAIINENGSVVTTHKAGAGELVSMLIQTELSLSTRHIAEEIKKYPLAKVESLYHMRLENGAIHFFEEPIEPKYFGNVVLLHPDKMIILEDDIPMEKIVAVRREVKKKVFVRNAMRALIEVAPEHNLRNIENVVLVGGSAQDFEVPEMLMEEFANYKIVCGRGNIRAIEGPRNAVATGLVMSYIGERHD
ncbi:diol dehydratase reactivase subunit alpha [Candidatus Galacturonibacter soehngenii]|uniref:Diol dehydratase reactivase subunit alpha n=1 Tax=Candidatus Galacturonatibacter soehngenii TaxID=2307010 RepID=A0A7V7QJY9_9FIRM|nr:diol dehydratase reactivase subunit alpha [Candidatus Galacturonibacter soehngenii]KAB1437901.1 diol dehydratase reactivase subunit alpha [Candidatus Galacturonibacter soehngenii]